MEGYALVTIRDTEASIQEWNDKENLRLLEVEQKYTIMKPFSIREDCTRYMLYLQSLAVLELRWT